ncbi:hypothetical protein RJ639_044832 [Escallonia herrerae]|uniref:Uncharacterized protein n=1 Tax=Escallonia herrerae TaxID=1293975 RepID=A0AA89B2V2_9ASTE|nr:hypothetical protein RJ639_044832 [Escallonia herrerae]
MDSDFWTTRLAAAKRQFTLQNHHLNSQLDRLSIDDFEVEEETRPDFPCPYCYEDFDIGSLCSHLEDEHSSESKVTVCFYKGLRADSGQKCSTGPEHDSDIRREDDLSRTRLKMNTAERFVPSALLKLQETYYMQRRRRLRRVAVPNSQALSLLGRDLREAHLQVLLGGGRYRSKSATAPTDPFLSSLVLNFPSSEAEEISKSITSVEDTSTKSVAPQHIWKSSYDPSLSYEEREKRMKQAAGIAVFLQDLLVSTLLTN